MNNLYEFENRVWNEGFNLIAGVDEAGRGPLCGPVVASAVVLPQDFKLDGLTDSKKLTRKKLDAFYEYIMEKALYVGVSIVDSKKIDEINIYEAARVAMIEAIRQVTCNYVLIDAMPIPTLDIPNESIIKGDGKSISIAAASVIAKVTRDRYMEDLALTYPQYGFDKHKGYGTKLHLEAIEQHGIIDEHRRSFAPVKNKVYVQETLSLF